jgi:FMN phosphatase YigB (HAD superfamily)
MHVSAILFDLDGTLLPMDRQRFLEAYLFQFTKKCETLGLDVVRAQSALQAGLAAMLNNDGGATNEQVFWEQFSSVFGQSMQVHRDTFIRFYREEFSLIRHEFTPSPHAAEIVQEVKEKGYITVLATTPVFPRSGTLERLSWAQVDPSWFDLITTYEDFSHTKPHLGYYQEILSRLQLAPENCLMVGNDVTEDLVVQQLGMEVYLVTDHLINREEKDISTIRSGDLSDFLTFCRELAPVVHTESGQT